MSSRLQAGGSLAEVAGCVDEGDAVCRAWGPASDAARRTAWGNQADAKTEVAA